MTNEVGEPILYEQMIIANAPLCLSAISNPKNTAAIMNIQGKNLNVLDLWINGVIVLSKLSDRFPPLNYVDFLAL